MSRQDFCKVVMSHLHSTAVVAKTPAKRTVNNFELCQHEKKINIFFAAFIFNFFCETKF